MLQRCSVGSIMFMKAKLGSKKLRQLCTRCALCTCFATVALNCCLFIAVMQLSTRSVVQPLINTAGCIIPYVDPFETEILNIVRPNGSVELLCSVQHLADGGQRLVHDLTYVTDTDGYVCLNQSVNVTQFSKRVAKCAFFSISRQELSSNPDYSVRYSESMRWFQNGCMSLNDSESEFVKVLCFDHQMATVYTNYYATIKPTRRRKERDAADFNVLMLGIDAVSRLNFNRQMPNTSSLLRQLGFDEFFGFNKVSANSLLNMVPILAGKYLRQYDPSNSRITKFDQLNIIWKEFSKAGYATLFAEDAPEIAIFNYYKGGFRRAPTDHYLRPFSVAMEADTSTLWNHGHHCVGSRAETQIVLDWLTRFYTSYDALNVPWFAFAFLTRLTHADPVLVRAADRYYHHFFRALNNSGALDRTLVFLFSDHGARFGPLRQTDVGQLEERLPVLFAHVPDHLRNALGNDSLRAFNANQHRLVTPFDIYETLVHVANRTGKARPTASKFGTSLFSEIPETRTCSSAGVEAQWCACDRTPFAHAGSGLKWKAASVKRGSRVADVPETIVHTAAAHILVHINKLTSAYRTICANLELSNIVSVTTVRSGLEKAHYTIVVLTKQTTMFEADVAVSFHQDDPSLTVYQLLGEPEPISRIELVAYCCNDIHVRKYCACHSAMANQAYSHNLYNL